MWCFEICLHCEMITIIKLINTPIISHSYLLCRVRTLKIYFLSKFQIYNKVSLAVVTMLYTRYSELINLIKKVCFLWPTSPHLPHPPTPGSRLFTLCFYELNFFLIPHINETHRVFVFISLSTISFRFIHTVSNGRISFLFHGWIIFHYILINMEYVAYIL